jgi:PAS domain S-box-containing protein
MDIVNPKSDNGICRASDSFEAFGSAAPIVPALFRSPVVGVSVIDRAMRFRAINPTLAAMNGAAPQRHIGQNIRFILGGTSRKVQAVIDQVLQTEQPVCNFELIAKLPMRRGVGHWVESYLPVRDSEGNLKHVVVLVLEITPSRRLQSSLARLLHNLSLISMELKAAKLHAMEGRTEAPPLISRSAEMLELCIAETRRLDAIGKSFMTAVPQSENSGAMFDTAGSAHRLTPRELSVLKLLADAKSNKEIAQQLALSARTIETYRARVMAKLGLHSMAELVRYAIRNEITKP